MYEKLFLNMVYECGKANIELPWDRVAHRLEPGTSKDAILQAVERLRQTCLAEGHMIPPEIGTKDPWTRGFTRVKPDSFDENYTLHCRPVGWYEEVDHPKEKNPSAERLTFNGTHKFHITYAGFKAPIPDEWKEDTSKRKNEVRMTAADVVAMAKKEEEEQYTGSSSSSAAHSQSAAPISSSTAEHHTSDAFSGDNEDSDEDGDEDMEYDDDGEDKEDEDGGMDEPVRYLSPKLAHTHIDTLRNGRRMPRASNASRQQSVFSARSNSPLNPASTAKNVNKYGTTPKGYMQNARAIAFARNGAQPNGLPPVNPMPALNNGFTTQTMARQARSNAAHGLETSQD